MENHVITTDIVTKYKAGLSFDHITFNSFLESTVQNRLGGL